MFTTLDALARVRPEARARNTLTVAAVEASGLARRLETNRPSDLPLIYLLLGPHTAWPIHADDTPRYQQIGEGVFTADLPAAVTKAVWITEEGFTIGTYQNSRDRDQDVLL